MDCLRAQDNPTKQSCIYTILSTSHPMETVSLTLNPHKSELHQTNGCWRLSDQSTPSILLSCLLPIPLQGLLSWVSLKAGLWLPSLHKSCRIISSSAKREGLLLQLFPGPKEKQEMETYLRFKTFKQFCEITNFQDGDCLSYNSIVGTRGLVFGSWPSGSLLSYLNSPISQMIPVVFDRTGSLPFSLLFAPRVFSKVVAEVSAYF